MICDYNIIDTPKLDFGNILQLMSKTQVLWDISKEIIMLQIPRPPKQKTGEKERHWQIGDLLA